MKIALAQLNYHTGNFEANTQKILDSVQLVSGKADLILFSELAVCGYPPRDFLEFNDFIDQCEESIKRIAAASNHIDIVIGAPARNKSGKGKPLYNAAFYLSKGEIREVIHKSLLPTYDVFDEYRYFEPAESV